MTGVMLELYHPELAIRSCDLCRKYEYDDKGQIKRWRGGLLERIMSPPCCYPQGCPKGHYDDQKSLTSINRMAYEHYLECDAVGHFPDDPIVRRNARIIKEVIEIYARYGIARSIARFLRY